MQKTRSKSEEKRGFILSAATKLFCEQGFSTTSMEQIAKEAGVSKQTVYSHFGSKDELFTASISNECVSYQMVDLVSGRLDDPKHALTIIATNFIKMLTPEKAIAMHRTCVAESLTYPHVSRLFFAAGPQNMITELETVLTQFNDKGLLTLENTRMAAIQFLCLVKGEICMQIEYSVEKTQTESEIKAYLDSSVAMFLRGYSAH